MSSVFQSGFASPLPFNHSSCLFIRDTETSPHDCQVNWRQQTIYYTAAFLRQYLIQSWGHTWQVIFRCNSIWPIFDKHNLFFRCLTHWRVKLTAHVRIGLSIIKIKKIKNKIFSFFYRTTPKRKCLISDCENISYGHDS